MVGNNRWIYQLYTIGNVLDLATLGVVVGFLRVPHFEATVHATEQTAK